MFDPHPQHLALLASLRVQRRLHGLQNLAYGRRIVLPTEDLPCAATAILEPQSDDIEDLVCDMSPIPALQRHFVTVEQAF